MKIVNNKIIILYFIFQIFLPGSVIAINLSDDEGVIWETGRNVYVKYAEQDSSKFGENDHPVVLKTLLLLHMVWSFSSEVHVSF